MAFPYDCLLKCRMIGIIEGEQGKKYASAIGKIVESVQAGLEEVSGSENDGVRDNDMLSDNLLTCHPRIRFVS